MLRQGTRTYRDLLNYARTASVRRTSNQPYCLHTTIVEDLDEFIFFIFCRKDASKEEPSDVSGAHFLCSHGSLRRPDRYHVVARYTSANQLPMTYMKMGDIQLRLSRRPAFHDEWVEIVRSKKDSETVADDGLNLQVTSSVSSDQQCLFELNRAQGPEIAGSSERHVFRTG